MQIEHTIKSVQDQVRQWQYEGLKVGFVPTMGNLHAGHLSLVGEAKKHCHKVVVSIFVNPLQFGPNEDFDSYPRTLEQDSQVLVEAKVDMLFAPTVNEMYPHGREGQTQVNVPGIGDILEGESRPGFFSGVATVVNKLFHIVPADVAVFGEKDFQQLMVIRKLVADMNMAIEIIAAPIMREANGLAMSSRNGYLTEQERQQAATLYQTLQKVAQQLQNGRTDFGQLEAEARQALNDAGFVTDYLTIRNSDDLQPANAGTTDIVVLAAAKLGKTRLIDNISVNLQ
jgi:pantoate--beta-alanine ligase